MKKLFLSVLALTMLLTGCGSKNTGDKATTAQNGDVITIDFVGKLDGKVFDGGSAENQSLFLGSGQFIDGFEEQIVGMSIDEKKTIEVTFPKEYGSSDLAGKDATFDINMKNIYKEADKDYASKKGDVITIDFVGKLNGEKFEGGSAQNQSLFLGSGQYIAGFEEQIEGMKVKEEKTIKVTFPKDYGSQDLAGKDATFDITMKEIYVSIK